MVPTIDLKALYCTREYHNWDHIVQVKQAFAEFEPISDVMNVVIEYHDVVYEAGSSYNEELSALLSISALSSSTDKVFAIEAIQASKKHVATGVSLIDLFLDADMSILAAPFETYLKYVQNIRKEYWQYADADFKKGREKFLKSFNGFITPEFSKKYNERAYENINKELQGMCPTHSRLELAITRQYVKYIAENS